MNSDVFIGMPVYNGERFLAEAVDALRAQTHTQWKLFISDNASTDRTEELCREFAAKDDRITYFRQPTNVGVLDNFDFTLARAEGDHFMWASSDDEWKPEFLEVCVEQLAKRPEAGFAFTDLVNIDSQGTTIRTYPSFSRFSTASRRDDVRAFLRDFEIMGKANLIYSLFRRDLIQETWPILRPIWHDPLGAEAGADMGCVLGLIARRPVAVTPRVLFAKRMITEKDGEEQWHEYEGRLKMCLPKHLYPTHCRYMVEATAGTEWERLTRFETTKRRWLLTAYRKLRKKR